MALLDSEVMRIKKELGYPLLTNSAYPYIDGYIFLFEQIIQPYLQTGAATTSSTPVASAEAPTPATLTLASVVDVHAGDTMIVDVDARQERVTIQSVTGSTVTALLSLEHAGTYPISIEGGESIVRGILRELSNLANTISEIRDRVGIKKAEDIEFFGGGATLASQGIDPLTQVLQLREYWRDELASALGIPRLNGEGSSGGSSVSVY